MQKEKHIKIYKQVNKKRYFLWLKNYNEDKSAGMFGNKTKYSLLKGLTKEYYKQIWLKFYNKKIEEVNIFIDLTKINAQNYDIKKCGIVHKYYPTKQGN